MNVDFNTVGLGVIAVLNLAGLVVAYQTRKLGLETQAIALKTEVNTNSMKDALVKAEKIASHAEGREEMKLETDIAAKAVVEAAAEKAVVIKAESVTVTPVVKKAE